LNVVQFIRAVNENAWIVEELGKALIGYAEVCGGSSPVALYDYDKAVEILIGEGMTLDEAREWLESNVLGSYINENMPIFATIMKENTM
jgi:hypothetical protein